MKNIVEKTGMVLISFLILISGFMNTGCTDEAEIPAFIRLDTILLDSTNYDSVGSVSHKITHAWIYIDDNLQGVYQLPCKIPVIEKGKKDIKIFGGVPESGFSTQASQYIFYDYWQDSVALVEGDTTVLEPHVKYKRILVPFKEDFETISILQIDRESGQGAFTYSTGPDAKEGTGYGYMTLGQGQTDLVCTTKVITTPKGELGYFIEMDYRNNCDFFVGIRTSQQSETILGVLPKTEYNKIYINVTNQVDAIPGTDVQLFFILPQDTSVVNQEVRIDNLKFIF